MLINEADIISVEQARERYGLREVDSPDASPLDLELVQNGLARIATPDVSLSDIETLWEMHETCIAECPDLLLASFTQVDRRYAYEAGGFRKEAKVDPVTGAQVDDPKHIFHFNLQAYMATWRKQFTAANSPKYFRDFLDAGTEMQQQLVPLGQRTFEQLEPTHPGIYEAYYAGDGGRPLSFGFFRLGSYDAYDALTPGIVVAKMHTDASGATFQIASDAPGFHGLVNDQEVPFDSQEGYAHFFMGKGHEALYGPDSRIKALRHLVKRTTLPEGGTAPKRHVAVNFIEAPYIDYGLGLRDTAPQAIRRDSM